MLKICIPFMSLALVAQAPAPAPPRPPMPPRAGMPPRPAAPEVPEPKPTDVLATLGKRTIRYEEFTKWLKVMAGPRADMIRKTSVARLQAQKQFLDLQVLSAKAQQEKLQASPDYRAIMAALEQQALARVLMDEDRPGGDGQALKQKIENPSETELQAYFKANSDRYATPERFTARHILVSVKGSPNAGAQGRTDAEAQARIAKIQEELKAGKKFADLAAEYSDDPGSKTNGGLYKDIPFGRFAKEFEAAVRSQEIGKVGEPVKTMFGYHLILVESRSPKQAAEYDKVKDQVRRQMIPERREKMNKEYLDRIKKEVGYRETPAPAAPQAPAPKVP